MHNIVQCTGSGTQEVVDENFKVTHVPIGAPKPLAKAPKWLARPCGATFGAAPRLRALATVLGKKGGGEGQLVQWGRLEGAARTRSSGRVDMEEGEGGGGLAVRRMSGGERVCSGSAQ